MTLDEYNRFIVDNNKAIAMTWRSLDKRHRELCQMFSLVKDEEIKVYMANPKHSSAQTAFIVGRAVESIKPEIICTASEAWTISGDIALAHAASKVESIKDLPGSVESLVCFYESNVWNSVICRWQITGELGSRELTDPTMDSGAEYGGRLVFLGSKLEMN